MRGYPDRGWPGETMSVLMPTPAGDWPVGGEARKRNKKARRGPRECTTTEVLRKPKESKLRKFSIPRPDPMRFVPFVA